MTVRSMFAAALLAAPGIASAGVGVSYSPPLLSAHSYSNADDFFLGGLYGGFLVEYTAMPTLDLRLETADLQFHVLDLISYLADDGNIMIGVNGYYHVVEKPMGSARVVFHPGAQVDVGLLNDELLLQILIAGRAGVEFGEGAPGIGVYAIPDLGVSTYNGDSGAIFGGSVGFSVWY